jgi:3',5'-cyclic AMP phosphodiesterase CpdA
MSMSPEMSPEMSPHHDELRVAHFSDTHVLSLKGVALRELLNKRLTGAVNLALNRAKHYRVEVFEQLLDAVIAVKPDHSLCTGDLVNLALAPEFERVRELLEARFEPSALTLVPGNHDYYTKSAALAGSFEGSFAPYLPHELNPEQEDTYPVTRLIEKGSERLSILGVSTAIPTASFMATGEVGEAQRERLQRCLSAPQAQGAFKLLMLHHPLFPEPARRLDLTRRLRDAEPLIEQLERAEEGARPDLIIHGHNHEYKRQALPNTQVPVLQVASASRAGSKRAEFHVYVISRGSLVRVERHIHDPESGRFIASDEQGLPLS